MLREFVLVMMGGAVGAALRYAVGILLQGIRFAGLPIGTLVVNLVGCLLLGLLLGVGERYLVVPRQLMLMLTVGMCGAFTTFSTFSSETIKAIDQGLLVEALAYMAISLVGGLLLFYIPYSVLKP